jgi:hypothetical protein
MADGEDKEEIDDDDCRETGSKFTGNGRRNRPVSGRNMHEMCKTVGLHLVNPEGQSGTNCGFLAVSEAMGITEKKAIELLVEAAESEKRAFVALSNAMDITENDAIELLAAKAAKSEERARQLRTGHCKMTWDDVWLLSKHIIRLRPFISVTTVLCAETKQSILAGRIALAGVESVFNVTEENFKKNPNAYILYNVANRHWLAASLLPPKSPCKKRKCTLEAKR